MTDIAELSATDLRRMIARREISPREMLAATRARIDRLNPHLNAFVEMCWPEAEREAAITRTDGVKTFCAGHISDAEGITVEAEGVFITPRWLRD